jgi:hypothetical protein
VVVITQMRFSELTRDVPRIGRPAFRVAAAWGTDRWIEREKHQVRCKFNSDALMSEVTSGLLRVRPWASQSVRFRLMSLKAGCRNKHWPVFARY